MISKFLCPWLYDFDFVLSTRLFFCKPCLNVAIHLQMLHFLAKCFVISLLTVEKKLLYYATVLVIEMWESYYYAKSNNVRLEGIAQHIIQIFKWINIKYYYSYMSVTCVFFFCHLMFPTLILYISFILKKCALILKWCVWPLSVLFLINRSVLVSSYTI